MEQIERTKYLKLVGNSLYVRLGGKYHPMPSDIESPEFKAAYDAVVSAHKSTSARVGRPSAVRAIAAAASATTEAAAPAKRKGYAAPQVGFFIEQWLASDKFRAPDDKAAKEKPYAANTQYNYRLELDRMRAEGLADGILNDLTPRNAGVYINRIKEKFGAAAAHVHKSLLSNLWRYASKRPEFNCDRTNPTRDGTVESPYEVRQEHKPWPDEVIEDFLGECDANLFFAFHLLLGTAQRVSDVVKFRWSDIKGEHIHLRQKKDREGRPLRIRMPKALQRLVERRERVGEFILTNSFGRPYTRKSLSQMIKRVLVDVGHDTFTTHGLRKNAGIMLAVNGASVPVIQAALGHKTPDMALYYVRLASQHLLADDAADIMDKALAGKSYIAEHDDDASRTLTHLT